MTTINGTTIVSVSASSSESDPIRRYSYERERELFTLADAVDHLLMTEEIGSNEARAVERCVLAAKSALASLPAYSPSGFRLYQGRSYLDVGEAVDVGEITVSSGVVSPTVAFSRPSYMNIASLVVAGRAYRVVADGGATFQVAGLGDGTYESSTLEQRFVRLPADFRRRGSITYDRSSYPVSDAMASSIDSWQDTNRGNTGDMFAAVTGDSRFHGELFLSVWPAIRTPASLLLTYDRSPRPLETHRVSVEDLAFTGDTASASANVFAEKHAGACLVVGYSGATEISQSLSSTDLIQQKRVVAAVGDATSITLDRDPGLSGSLPCYLSDIIDVTEGPMREAYLRLCEFELAKLTKSSRSMGVRESYFRKSLDLALADDSRYDSRMDSQLSMRGFSWGMVDGSPGS